jgi:hypothetical protein
MEILLIFWLRILKVVLLYPILLLGVLIFSPVLLVILIILGYIWPVVRLGNSKIPSLADLVVGK